MYTQSITRSRRTAFFLAIDCSGSMAEPIRFRGRPTTKAEAVASVANGLLFELIERARRSDGVRNYYDIAGQYITHRAAEEIKALRTADGNVLVVNIHIAAADTSAASFFPSEEEPRYPNRYAALLYDCSSVMPAVFDEAIRAAKGPGAVPPFRGVSYNASADELVAMLNIGSISVKTE